MPRTDIFTSTIYDNNTSANPKNYVGKELFGENGGANVNYFESSQKRNLYSTIDSSGKDGRYLQNMPRSRDVFTYDAAGNPKKVPIKEQLENRKQAYRDWRARIKVSKDFNPYYSERNYYILGAGGFKTVDSGIGDSLLRILTTTGGLVFPYTPTVTHSQGVNYADQVLLHSNASIKSYQNTPSPNISVSGKFTASNKTEALYLIAVIHFLQAVVKCDFGEKTISTYKEDVNRGARQPDGLVRGIPGLPPPILYFSAFGDLAYNEAPIVITGFNYTWPDDKDYIEVILEKNNLSMFKSENDRTEDDIVCRVPTEFMITVEMAIQPNMTKMRKEFNLTDFKTGKLMNDYGNKSGWTW